MMVFIVIDVVDMGRSRQRTDASRIFSVSCVSLIVPVAVLLRHEETSSPTISQ